MTIDELLSEFHGCSSVNPASSQTSSPDLRLATLPHGDACGGSIFGEDLNAVQPLTVKARSIAGLTFSVILGILLALFALTACGQPILNIATTNGGYVVLRSPNVMSVGEFEWSNNAVTWDHYCFWASFDTNLHGFQLNKPIEPQNIFWRASGWRVSELSSNRIVLLRK